MTSGIVDGRFEIERLAGHGGMGVVYRARDRRDGAQVALKVLAQKSVINVERFHLEAELLSALQHPGIVRYVAHGVAETGEPYLAMEWLEGCDLQEKLQTSPLGVVESLAVIRQAAEALAMAHARGLVHRDVKPSNLFLVDGQVERVKLLDFGVARGGRAGRALTGTGGVVGTLCYMAPEQARGSPHIDARADVFSLGGVLFECLTGRPPFHGDTPLEVLTHILFDEPPRLAQTMAEVPPGVDELIARLLAPDPESRPADAGDVARLVSSLIIPPGFDRVAVRAPAKESLGVAEQRLVTVVLVGDADLPPISSNDLLAHLSTTHWVDQTHDLATERARRPLIDLLWNAKSHGARTERLLDGSLVVTLQGTEAATDQAARAARWALSLRRLLPGTAIALATGRGLVSRGASRDTNSVAGVVANAARLLNGDGAGRGAVRIDKLTAELLSERFALRTVTPGVHDLFGEREASGTGRRLLGRPTPCLGRERELAMLSSLLDEVRAEPVARVALVTGPAGIGKSRLRHELLQRCDPRTTEIWSAAGNPMSQGSAFALIAQMIRGAARIVDGQPLEVRRRALLDRVGRHLPPEPARDVAELLGEICGTPFLEEGSPLLRALKQDPRLLGARMRSGFARWLAAETSERLILIAIEDLQWGDLPTVKFIDEALAELHDRPLMVLAMARPDVHKVFPQLWGERSLFELRLPELGKRASEALVRDALGDRVGPDTIKRVVARAEGNAFFLEELIRAVAEGRGDALPETVLGMLQQRLEAFPPSTRRVIRAASLYGDVFWRAGLNPLLGDEMLSGQVGDALERLIDREVFEVRARSRFPGQEELRFRHALVREAAYAMLTDEDRALGHRLAGSWLERAGETDAVAMAEHFERGGETERAIDWWARAAKEALEGHDDEAALARAERGIACGAAGEVRGLLRQIQASAEYVFRRKGEEAERYAIEAVELLPLWSDAWCLAAQALIMVSGSLGHHEHFFRVARMTVENEWPGEPTGAQIQLAAVVGLAHVLLGIREPARALWDRVERAAVAGVGERDALAATRIAFVRAGRAGYFDLDLWTHIEKLREALSHARRLGDPVLTAWLLMSLGVAWNSIAAHREAAEAFGEALALAKKVGLEPEALAAQSALHRLAVLDADGRARGSELVAAQREIFAELKKRREPYYRMNSQLWLAEMLADLGDREAALRESENAVDEAFSPLVRAVALALRARLLLDGGDAAGGFAAARQSREYWEIAPSPHALLSVATVWPAALRAHGELAAAETAAEESRALLHRAAAKIPDGPLRDAFMRACDALAKPAA